VSLDVPFEELKIDSLDFISIVREVENVYNVEIPNDRLSGIRTIRDLIEVAQRPSN
jgi:acyl carrier protein